MEAQKERAKAASQKIDLTLKGSIEREIDLFDQTIFEGYDSLNSKGLVKGIFFEANSVEKATQGQAVQIILDQTSFYGESGGQVGDTGTISGDGTEIYVDKVIRKKNIFLHCGMVKKGEIFRNQLVETRVDNSNRAKAESNHTATHLLQSALKIVIDDSVSQRGSLVAFNKLRFDFNSPQPLSKEQILQIESLVNAWILENHPIQVKQMEKDEALKAGALAMFGEKYGDIVRVVDVPGVSMELCGGTHVRKTSDVGSFKIISELGISSGIRRIEALSGQLVLDYLKERDDTVNKLSDLLKASPSQLFERVNSLQSELINKNKEIQKMKDEIAFFKYSSLSSSANKIGLFSLIISQLDGLDGNSLQSAALDLTSKLGDKSAVILGGIPDKENRKLLFVVSFGEDLVKRGMHAGKLINDISRICSGGGGGKPNFAQAGGKDIDKLSDALEYARKDLRTKLLSYSDK